MSSSAKSTKELSVYTTRRTKSSWRMGSRPLNWGSGGVASWNLARCREGGVPVSKPRRGRAPRSDLWPGQSLLAEQAYQSAARPPLAPHGGRSHLPLSLIDEARGLARNDLSSTAARSEPPLPGRVPTPPRSGLASGPARRSPLLSSPDRTWALEILLEIFGKAVQT